ncbi:hypothetical protein [Carbonactinospora thermoautotrophica]|uniref:hypothetical protein n=1 Tax=Carbonactinospora thermoautotrophica TaxID=1469144 RepID=UPI000ABD9C9F|nr:hypothetical protein [Carbonactinospora thermoautotrophica]
MLNRILSVAGVATLVLSLSVSPAAAQSEKSVEERVDEILAYQDAHPDDLEGLEQLVERYTGKKTQVRIAGIDKDLTGAEAQRYLDAAKAQHGPAGQIQPYAGIPLTLSP